MNAIRKSPYGFGILACTLVLTLFLLTTNPNQLAIGLLVIPIVLIFLILLFASHISLNRAGVLATQPRKRRALAIIISSLISVVLILQSSGGISVPDIILLGLIVVVLGVYVNKF